MGHSHLRLDLAVLRQGLHLALDFGLQPVEELARIAELLEHSVYESGSLGSNGREVTFTLLNPPLRTGAFDAARIFWDGASTPVVGAWAAGPEEGPRPLETVRRDSPLVVPVGRRTRFGFPQRGLAASGTRKVRLELHSVAIPPLVWFEFSDRLREDPPG